MTDQTITTDIDFGLKLDTDSAVVQGPWAKGAEAEAAATEQDVESRDKALAARKAKAPEKRVEEAAERMKKRVMAKMADTLESDELSLEERLARMGQLAQRYVGEQRFKPGDLVTPARKVNAIVDSGEPHIVLEVIDPPKGNEKDRRIHTDRLGGMDSNDVGNQVFGATLDMRILKVTVEGMASTHWVESWIFENWTPPEEAGAVAG